MDIAIIGTTASSLLGFRKDLIKSLVNDGNVVFAFAVDYTEATRESVMALGAKPIDYTLSRSGINPIVDVWHTLKLAKILKRLSVETVFCYFSKPVIFGTFAARFAGVKRRVAMLEGLGYVFTEQRDGISYRTKFLKKIQVILYRLAFPLINHIVFLNHDDPIDLVKKYDIRVNRVSILDGIGLDLDEYCYSVPFVAQIRFLFIGRLLAEKGVHEFVSAARIVKEKYPTAEFIVLGGVDLANPGGLSQNALSEYVSQGLITHPGYVENVTDWIKESSVFVLPSYREGLPRSTQEAMAMGRAIITTDVPGCRETVEDGVNGFIIPPFSAIVLAEKMMLFLEDESLIKSMGIMSNKIAVARFDEKLINKELISIIKGNVE